MSEERYSPGVAFGLWLACLLGLCGLHRFYLGKPMSGLLYLLTFGLLGVGQVVDLVRLNTMVEDENLIALGRNQRALQRYAQHALQEPERDPEEQLRQDLLKAAASRGGRISVNQAVLATGKSHEKVEAALDDMARRGHAEIDNDPDSGIVIYRFGDLA